MLFSYWDSQSALRDVSRARRCSSLNQLTGAPLRKQGLKVSLRLGLFRLYPSFHASSSLQFVHIFSLSLFLSFFLSVILHMQIRQLNPTPTISIRPFSLSVLLLPSLLSSLVPYCLFSSVIQLSLSLSLSMHPLFSPSLPLSLHHLPPIFSPSLLCFSSLTLSFSLSLSLSSSSHSTYSLAINQPVILRHARWISLGLVARTCTHAHTHTHTHTHWVRDSNASPHIHKHRHRHTNADKYKDWEADRTQSHTRITHI